MCVKSSQVKYIVVGLRDRVAWWNKTTIWRCMTRLIITDNPAQLLRFEVCSISVFDPYSFRWSLVDSLKNSDCKVSLLGNIRKESSTENMIRYPEQGSDFVALKKYDASARVVHTSMVELLKKLESENDWGKTLVRISLAMSVVIVLMLEIFIQTQYSTITKQLETLCDSNCTDILFSHKLPVPKKPQSFPFASMFFMSHFPVSQYLTLKSW